MEKENNFICAYCHQPCPIWDTRPVNRGIEGKEHRICASCADTYRDNGKIIQCDACGECFTSDMLHDGSQRGYVVSVDSSAGIAGVVKKLAEKVNLCCAASIIIAEIVTDEDEF